MKVIFLCHPHSHDSSLTCSITSVTVVWGIREGIDGAHDDILSPESCSNQIIDDIFPDIEKYFSLFICEVFGREVFEEISLNFIEISLNMRSYIRLDFLPISRHHRNRLLPDMYLSSSPSTMDSSTFTTSHEDDDRAINTSNPDRETIFSGQESIDIFRTNMCVLSSDDMDWVRVNLILWLNHLRKEIFPKCVPIMDIRDEYLETSEVSGCLHIIERYIPHNFQSRSFRLHHSYWFHRIHRLLEHGVRGGW